MQNGPKSIKRVCVEGESLESIIATRMYYKILPDACSDTSMPEEHVLASVAYILYVFGIRKDSTIKDMLEKDGLKAKGIIRQLRDLVKSVVEHPRRQLVKEPFI